MHERQATEREAKAVQVRGAVWRDNAVKGPGQYA